MNAMASRWLRCGLALVAVAGTSCASDDLINDPSFDKWCGDALCYWSLDTGKIREVPTWHAKDTGVELVGSGTEISQLSRARSIDCILFELISDAPPGARIVVELDFNDDGTVDFENVLPAQRWVPSEFQIRAPERYHGFRVRLRKEGSGRAVVAQMGLREDLDGVCAGKPLKLEAQGEGAACERDAECVAGGCIQGTCTTCLQDGTCTPEVFCKESSRCDGAGGCDQGFCSECEVDSDCAQGQACSLRWGQQGDGPKVCQ